MSFFNEQNRDEMSVAPEAAATGKRVGFLESFAVGWEEQVRGAAVYGIQEAMRSVEDRQLQAMREAGIEDVPALSSAAEDFWQNIINPGNEYMDAARFYEDGGDPSIAGQLSDFDKRIETLRETYPDLGLKTSREMWDEVRSTAQEYEQRASTDRRDLFGQIGAFAGGSLGALNPNTDPLNFATLGVGGVGKTVIGRIAGQAGAQGLIEGVNQITGVQEQRRLLGLDYGVGDAVSRVAGAAVGGAAIQGVGEVVGFGLRRWFKSTPTDTALPPTPEVLDRAPLPDASRVPPTAIPADEGLAAAKLTQQPESYIDYIHERAPLSTTRAGRARTVLDLDYVTERLDDWNGERPWELAPKTDTAPINPRGDFVAMPDMTRLVERAQIDDIARRVDPDTFRLYDELAQRKQTQRRWLDELRATQDADITARIDSVDQQIFELAARAEETGGKRAAKLRKDIAALEATKRQIVEESGVKETPDMARVRRSLMLDDEKMRELAPLVSRAYARAQRKWKNTEADHKNIAAMLREGRTDYRADPQTQALADALPEAVPLTLADRAPILQQADKVAGKVARDADAADVAQAIVAENVKELDRALEVYRASLDGLIGSEKNGEITINGASYKLNLDKDKLFIPNEDGTGGREVSVRELLEQNKMDEYEIEAVSSCSLR